MIKEIARFNKTRNPDGTGLVVKVLIITELKAHYKAEVWDSRYKGWRGHNPKPLLAAKLFSKDTGIDSIRSYFGF